MSFWVFIVLIWIVCNALTWICGWELTTKEKLIMPQIIIICLVLMSGILYILGVR